MHFNILTEAPASLSKSVWQYLQIIPYGERHSYGQIARSLETLTGYAGGLERKKWLLAMEAKFGEAPLVQA